MRNQNLAGNAFAFIQSWAAQTPDAIALLAPGRRPLTFSGLQRQIEVTEHDLSQCGIGPNEIVALAMPDGAEMAAAAIAVGRTRACAPLNPSFAVSECDYCLHALMPAALMAPRGIESAATAAARALAIPILDVHTDVDAPAGSFDVNLRSNIPPARGRDATDAAIILFTSATTGKPKLVPLSHTNLNAICRNTNLVIQLSPEDRFLNMMPQFHLQALASILVQWYAGGSVVCTQGFDPSGFLSWIVDFLPTWYTAGPTLHHTILTLFGRSPLPHRLRFLRSIGAPMTPELLLALENSIGVPVLEGYGLTETGLATSNPLPPMRRKPGSVGVPFGTDVNILDSAGMPLPIGAEGEIALRGPAVTSGYLDPVDANAAAFTNGWLRTGMVAYEMARQLEAAGEPIGLLALFDSLNPEYMPAFHRQHFIGRFLNSLKGQSKFHLACMRQLDLREIPDYVMQRLKALSERMRAKRPIRQNHSQTSRDEIDMEAWRPSGMRIFIRGYRPEPLKGPTVLFRSASWLNRNASAASLGWDARPGSRWTVHRIPGDHVSMFLEPNVSVLAEKLAESLGAFEK